ncbi:MAG: amino acid ABC transporter [Desulfobacteraceae bacterium]|nr:MAG: amino acid ABC transporter [Desulfobacteraceae bacterium]
MKHILHIMLLVLFGTSAPAYAQPLEIIMAYENTALPPFYVGEGKEVPSNPGIAVELLKLVDQKLPGITIKFRRIPWDKCQEELGEGKVDAIFPGSFNISRMKIGVYPFNTGEPDGARCIVFLSYYFYVLKDEPFAWESYIPQLEGTVGAPTGYSIVKDLQKMGLEVDDTAPTTLQNLMKLKARKVRAVAAQDVTADPLIKSNPALGGIVKISPPINIKPNYLIFSRQFYTQQPDLCKRIWSELTRVRKSHLEILSLKYT